MAAPVYHPAGVAITSTEVFMLPLAVLLVPLALQSPGSGTVVIKVQADSAPLAGAAVRAGRIGGYTNALGEARLVLAAGVAWIRVSRVGYHPDSVEVTVVDGGTETRTVSLAAETEELEEITVQATRGERRLDDEPVRVEVLGGGDVAEKTQMRPSDLTRLLTEMVGVRIQPSAGALGPTRFRIQGLRGQYTGLLADGLPLLGGQPSGFGILELAPVDLQQAEVIKGAATSLYGPSAIGGLVNLVSRHPDRNAGIFELNQTLRGGSDAILWLGRRVSPAFGFAVTAEGHRQDRRDLDGDRWADLPSQDRVSLRPRLFWDAPNGDRLFATIGLFGANRSGGFEPGAATDYRERLETRRFDLGIRGYRGLGGSTALETRVAVTAGSDRHELGATLERGKKRTLFGEVSLTGTAGRAGWVAGVAIQGDRFRAEDTPRFDFDHRDAGVFGQATVAASERLSFSLSGRCDDHNVYGTRCSPRGALLLKVTPELSARASAATGFFAPTPFTEETDPIGLTPLSVATLRAERAATAAFDLTWKRGIVELSGTLSRSRIANPTALVDDTPAGPGPLRLVNAGGPTTITSGELFAVIEAEPVVITAFYGYLHGTELDVETGLRRPAGYTPTHSFGADVAWEGKDTWIALEAFYTGEQYVYDNPFRTRSRAYVIPEVLVSQRIRKVRFYLNAENLFDLRQTGYERLVLPTPGKGGIRTTTPWAPVDGRIVSVGALIDF